MIAQMRMFIFRDSCPLWRSQTSDPGRPGVILELFKLFLSSVARPLYPAFNMARSKWCAPVEYIVLINDDHFDIHTIITVWLDKISRNTFCTMPDISNQKK